MDQGQAGGRAGFRQDFGPGRIGLKGRLLVRLRAIHLGVGAGVENDTRADLGYGPLHLRRIGDVGLSPRQTRQGHI